MKKTLVWMILLLMVIGSFTGLGVSAVEAKAKPTYKISPSSKTYYKNMMKYSTYNKYTKHYYLLRSYLERLEKTGGGTLVLKKGTYSISNALYIPSNVTIKLENNAKIVKSMKTGTRVFKASKSMFHFVRPSRSHKRKAYGGYSGEKNITFTAKGKAVISMNYVKDGNALLIGHNQNITIENIQFEKLHSGHFIEIDATKNSKIRNNTFTESKPSSGLNKEAINIDTPDLSTKGFDVIWSKQDKTPNRNMLIEGNHFYSLDRAIGTHKYSEGKLHTNIVIRNNTIDKMRNDAIRAMNWSNAIIEGNTIQNIVGSAANNKRGILASGVTNPTFRNNHFINMPRAMQFITWKNTGAGERYGIIYNSLSEKNLADLATNQIENCVEDFIRINPIYNKYGKSNTEFIPLQGKVWAENGEIIETLAQ